MTPDPTWDGLRGPAGCWTALASLLGLVAGHLAARGCDTVRFRRADDPARPRAPHVALALGSACLWGATAATLPPPTTPTTTTVLLVHLMVFTVGLALAAIDLELHRLPDVLTLPLGAACLTVAAAATTHVDPAVAEGARRAVTAGLAVPALAFTVTTLVGGIGLGDVKFSACLAALLGWHGWGDVTLAGLVTVVGSGGIAAGLLVGGRADPSTAVPLGPFLLLGTAVAVLT